MKKGDIVVHRKTGTRWRVTAVPQYHYTDDAIARNKFDSTTREPFRRVTIIRTAIDDSTIIEVAAPPVDSVEVNEDQGDDPVKPVLPGMWTSRSVVLP